jgi:hypothetical protein
MLSLHIHYQLRLALLATLFLGLSAYTSEASIHVTTQDTDVTFASRVQPLVGNTLAPSLDRGKEYLAHLQVIPGNIQLCPQEPDYDPVTKKHVPKVWNVTVPNDGIPGKPDSDAIGISS